MANKESKLETLYQFIESSKELNIDLPEDVLKQTAELEETLIREEVLPTLRDNIDPVLQKIKRELLLIVEYQPNEPISVRISRKRKLIDLSETTLLTKDIIPEIKPRSKQEHNGKREDPKDMIVTLDNRVFGKNQKATDTFCEVLSYFGLTRVRNLGIKRCGYNFISTSEDSERKQRKMGTYYVYTNMNTQAKADLLTKVAEMLGRKIHIELEEK